MATGRDLDAGLCPICKGGRQACAQNATFPFCSPRCKSVDLGNWLSENYRVPTDQTPGTGDGGDEAESGHE